jgi:filamentous hemagglutinin family protein
MMLNSKAVLLAGCALAAVEMGLAHPANAQAFDGTPTTVAGSVTYNRATPGVETVTINSAGAVINWDPNSLANFLPASNVATFQGTINNPNYTVLNRLVPSSGAPGTITFNGTVQSRNSAIDPTVGGQIYFYSPGGIIAGPTSVFNVGSLVLTTNDVSFDAAGNLGSPVLFNGVAGSKSAITIQPGAQLSATGAGAYIALVAPSINQGGTVSADGSIAYIAGESVDLTINTGLLDFTINTGTTDNNGVVHTGTTTGPASTSNTDTQVISMVALPKNAALTMLLTGSIGYTPAASAAGV